MPGRNINRAKVDGRRREAKRTKALARKYMQRLGVTGSCIPEEIRRAAELAVLAELVRAAALRGDEIEIGQVMVLDQAADAALRRLEKANEAVV
jgi:hypothetical protein